MQNWSLGWRAKWNDTLWLLHHRRCTSTAASSILAAHIPQQKEVEVQQYLHQSPFYFFGALAVIGVVPTIPQGTTRVHFYMKTRSLKISKTTYLSSVGPAEVRQSGNFPKPVKWLWKPRALTRHRGPQLAFAPLHGDLLLLGATQNQRSSAVETCQNLLARGQNS